jgi:hypothetical protein
MTWDENVIRSIFRAIQSGDANLVRELLNEQPDYKGYEEYIISWLHDAVEHGTLEVVKALVDLGMDINKIDQPAERSPLIEAIRKERLDVAKFLLSRGADPDLGRPLIAAINRKESGLALEFVKLLVEQGADLNRFFPWYGEEKVGFSPLGWAVANEKTEIVDYLRSKGAVLSDRELGGKGELRNLAEEIVAYFEEHCGAVKPQALIEIVPTEMPIAIRVVPPGKKRKNITLFTTGMSEKAMTVPPGNEEYRFAELFIELPNNWPLSKDALADPNYGWPIDWLRQIANYPHENDTWLGGPATIIANDDPPQVLAPKVLFTSIMLMAEESLISRDGRTIQLYRVFPLYTEERELEIKKGISALIRAFQKAATPLVVDLRRRSVAK